MRGRQVGDCRVRARALGIRQQARRRRERELGRDATRAEGRGRGRVDVSAAVPLSALPNVVAHAPVAVLVVETADLGCRALFLPRHTASRRIAGAAEEAPPVAPRWTRPAAATTTVGARPGATASRPIRTVGAAMPCSRGRRRRSARTRVVRLGDGGRAHRFRSTAKVQGRGRDGQRRGWSVAVADVHVRRHHELRPSVPLAVAVTGERGGKHVHPAERHDRDGGLTRAAGAAHHRLRGAPVGAVDCAHDLPLLVSEEDVHFAVGKGAALPGALQHLANDGHRRLVASVCTPRLPTGVQKRAKRGQRHMRGQSVALPLAGRRRRGADAPCVKHFGQMPWDAAPRRLCGVGEHNHGLPDLRIAVRRRCHAVVSGRGRTWRASARSRED